MNNDPVVRWTAALILFTAFTAALAVVVHGYWVDAAYNPPAFLGGIVTAGVLTATHILGVVLGGAQAAEAARQTRETIRTATNGKAAES